MSDAREIAAKLTKAQREALETEGLSGNPRGLVTRGLLRYRWGSTNAFGYVITDKGLAVRAALQEVA